MFKLNLHNAVKLIFALLFIALGIYVYNFFTEDRFAENDFKNATDLEAAYNADKEIAEAKKLLQDNQVVAATVFTHNVDGKKVIALTFDGLPRKATADRLLDVLSKHKTDATFFAEGGNTAMNPEIAVAIEDKGQTIGNYTYLGLSKLDTHTDDIIIGQLCKAQKVLNISTNKQIPYFKAPKTRYDIRLLKIAAACGLQSAVRTDVFVNVDAITDDAEAEKFVQSIKPGSIVSIVVNRPQEFIEQKEGKIDDKPAFDKQPNIELDDKPKVKHQDIVEVTERLLAACEKAGVKIVPLKQMRNVRLADPAPSTGDKVAKLIGWIEKNILSGSVAYAAELEDAVDKTQHPEIKMVLTTEPALAFTFVGFSKPAEVEAVLARMKELGVRGTFFVDSADIVKNDALMRKILAQGNEIGVAVYNRKSNTPASIEKGIAATMKLLKDRYGVTTNLVKQPWGVLSPELQQIAVKHGYTLVGHNVNIVQSKHQNYESANDIVPELFGKFLYSFGRGWIINFRMDFYTHPGVVADVMQLVKEQKIDNIAYWSFYDDPKLNPENDSAYAIKPVGELLANTSHRYTLPARRVPYYLRSDVNPVRESGEKFLDYVRKRYIGNDTVNRDSNTMGFTQAELRYIDTDGVVRTNDPVVFFTFDDWGTDAPINQLLYVLRKHHVKSTFFILTNNVKNNPNLLRAIAEEGHDIASHTDMHKPLAVMGRFEHMKPGMERDERFADLMKSYQDLEAVTGDVSVNGRYSLTRMFRPPTLTISKMGFEELYNAGFEFIVSGSTSTHDYGAENLYQMIDRINAGLYEKGKVKKGALFVMHMSDVSRYTARALDMVLTYNEMKRADDPTRFYVGRLSDYLYGEYDQSVKTVRQ